jgi:hypothetical protein
LFIRSSHLEEAAGMEEAAMAADLRVEAVDMEAVSGAAVGGKEVAEVSVCTFPYCLCSLACREYRGMFTFTRQSVARFEVITAVTTSNTFPWDVTLCRDFFVVHAGFVVKVEVKMETVIFSKTPLHRYQTTRCHKADDHN